MIHFSWLKSHKIFIRKVSQQRKVRLRVLIRHCEKEFCFIDRKRYIWKRQLLFFIIFSFILLFDFVLKYLWLLNFILFWFFIEIFYQLTQNLLFFHEKSYQLWGCWFELKLFYCLNNHELWVNLFIFLIYEKFH